MAFFYVVWRFEQINVRRRLQKRAQRRAAARAVAAATQHRHESKQPSGD
jgi:hypothetical protein